MRVLFLTLIREYPKLKELIDEQGNIREEEVLVLVNGVDIRVYEDPYNEIEIENSDEITFIPITHGG